MAQKFEIDGVQQAGRELQDVLQTLKAIHRELDAIKSAGFGGLPTMRGGASSAQTATTGSGSAGFQGGLNAGGLPNVSPLGLNGMNGVAGGLLGQGVLTSASTLGRSSAATAAGGASFTPYSTAQLRQIGNLSAYDTVSQLTNAAPLSMSQDVLDLYPGLRQAAAARNLAYQYNTNSILGTLAQNQAAGAQSDIAHAQMMRQAAISRLQAQQGIISDVRQSIGGAVVYGAADIARAYTQATISGTQNQLGYGAAYGAIGGGILGAVIGGGGAFAGAAAGAAAGSVVPGFGTIIGAVAGATLGAAGINAMQAGGMARLAATQTLAPYAAASGLNVTSRMFSAEAITAQSNEAFASQGGIFGRIGRFLHLYSGNDVISTQDTAKVQGALGMAYMDAGISVSNRQLDSNVKAFIGKYGGSSPDIMAVYAKAVGASNAAGNNVTSLASMVGVGATATYLRTDGRGAEADQLVRGWGALQRAGYGTTGALSDMRSASFSSTFGGLIGGMRGAIGAIDTELGALNALPGGADGNEAKAKRALRQELLSQIAKESVNKIQSDAGIRNASVGVEMTRASLYGNADSFAPVGKAAMASLNQEYRELQSSLNDRNLPFAERQQIKVRLREIDQARLSLPANTAGQEFRRGMLIADTGAGNAGAAYTVASLYGNNAQLGDAAMGVLQSQASIYSTAQRTLNDPNASVEDKAAAQQRMAGAVASGAQIRAGSRDILLGRLSNESAISNARAGLSLTKARYGTGDDVRKATSVMIGSLANESAQIDSQLAQGGLTVDQENRLRARKIAIESDQFTLRQGGIDAGLAKDDLLNDRIPRMRMEGQMERLQYLPYSSSNPIKLSVEMLGMNRRRLSMLSSREKMLRDSGDLSPERQAEIEQEREGLYTQNARAVGMISESFENRLPALSAGRPSFFKRFTSVSLAAEALRLMGSPVRSFGASNGSQMRMQDDYLMGMGASPADIGPRNMTGDMGSNQQIIGLLQRLVNATERNAANGLRPGERAGQWAGALSQKM